MNELRTFAICVKQKIESYRNLLKKPHEYFRDIKDRQRLCKF